MEKEKIALFVFNDNDMCFIHVLLTALDMHERQMAPTIVIEGAATGLVPRLASPGHQLHGLWEKVKHAGLVGGVCKACSQKTGAKESAVEQGLALLDDMAGHPSMSAFIRQQYTIITF